MDCKISYGWACSASWKILIWRDNNTVELEHGGPGTHPSGRAATSRLLVENALAPIPLLGIVLKGFLTPSPAGYDLVGEIECFVSILR
jgi:hypothetical protein